MTFSAWIAAHYEEKGPVAWLAFFLELIAAVTLFLLMLLTCAYATSRALATEFPNPTTQRTLPPLVTTSSSFNVVPA